MAEIQICQKPEWISYDELCRMLDEIHAGEEIEYSTTGLVGADLESKLNGGTCLVALDGTQAVGMAAVCLETCDRWYYRGQVGRLRYVGVLPSYQGRHIATNFIEQSLKRAKEQGLGAVLFSTSEYNQKAIAMYRKCGAALVDFRPYRNTGRCYVIGAFWLNKAKKQGISHLMYTCRKIQSKAIIWIKKHRKIRFGL